jgi:hypothetical protein
MADLANAEDGTAAWVATHRLPEWEKDFINALSALIDREVARVTREE